MTNYITSHLSIAALFMCAVLFQSTAMAQPASPILVHPVNLAQNQPHSLAFNWNRSVGAATYTLQISENLNFSPIAHQETLLADSVRFVDSLKFNTTYFWRLSATNGDGTSAFSSAREFKVWAWIPQGPDPVDLGSAARFAILAHSAVTNVPASAIKGDVGLSPAAGAFIGLSQTEVTGTMLTVDATGPAGSVESAVLLTSAKGALTIAYNDAAGRTVNPIGIAGNLGGQTIYPGLYKSTGTLEISAGDLTLDAGGNSNSVWIFQIASSFNMTSGRQVFLTNGAKASNIFWQMGSAATFGTTSVFAGTIMAGTQVTLATGASLHGRAMALTENVTLQQNAVTHPDLTLTVANEKQKVAPVTMTLEQNYPNPFNPSTVIRFELRTAGMAKLDVYNAIGQHVATLINGNRQAGFHAVSFDASGLTSGLYVYTLNVNGAQQTKKMLLMK